MQEFRARFYESLLIIKAGILSKPEQKPAQGSRLGGKDTSDMTILSSNENGHDSVKQTLLERTGNDTVSET